MKHGSVPIEVIRERKFGEACAAKEGPPVVEGGDAFPSILNGK